MLMLAAGVVALVMGLLGLLVPVLPGVLLLLVAVVLLAGASRRLNRALHRSPRIRPYLARWEASAGLGWLERARLAFWLSLAGVSDSLRR